MQTNIWQKLKKPFFILAPMENVTDTVFRQVVANVGKPDLFFTEFVSTAGLCSNGYKKVNRYLKFTQKEYPIIAQIWGTNPEFFLKTANLLAEMEFDGIDINMGCPDRKIIKKGSCGALINNPGLAKEIICATKEGAVSAGWRMPVSVKTRIGFNEIQTEQWISFLLEQDLAAITVHGRTVKEMSKVPAHWEEIGRAVQLRDQMKKQTLIIGNGDVLSREDGLIKTKKYNTDGIMIGRGIFHNLWIFSSKDPATVPFTDKLQLLIEHITLFEETWGPDKPFEVMKKFYKIYISGVPDASNIRTRLMELKTPGETIDHIKSLI